MSLPDGFEAELEDAGEAITMAMEGLESLHTKAKFNDLGDEVLRRIENKWRALKTQRSDVLSIKELAEGG